MTAAWYVLRTAPCFEHRVDDRLDEAGIVTWLPVISKQPRRQRRQGRRRMIRVAALPGYLFARLEIPASLPAIADIKGLIGILGSPTSVPDRSIERLRSFVERDSRAIEIICDALSIGQRVRIDDGPFAALSGIVREIGMDGRAAIELMVMGRAVPVRLDIAHISKVN